MILTSKHLIKRVLLNNYSNTAFKINGFSQKSINNLLPYSSILIAKSRSYFSTNKSLEKIEEVKVESEQTSNKKKTQSTRRKRQTEKENSDDSDNEGGNIKKSRVSQNIQNDYEESEQDNDPNSLKNAKGQSNFHSNDSIENLVSFDTSQDENFQNTQVLIDRIMKGEVEFNDGDPIEKLVTLDDVFKTRERRLSFQLMNLEDPLSILLFYDQEVERIYNRNGQEDPLSMDEVGLFFYFAAFQKKFISDNPIFQKILLRLIDNSRDLSVHSLQSFVWSLGSYMYEFGQIDLSEKKKKTLSDSILLKCKNFEYSQNPQLCFAISQIFSGDNDNPLSEPIIEKLADNSAEYIETLTHDELVTFIMTFMTIGFSNTTIISKFVERLVAVKEELTEEQIQKSICALGELNYGNSKQFVSLTKEIIDRDAGNSELKMSVDTACSLIFSLSGAQEKNEELLKKLLRVIHSKYKDMNITNYVNVWLALARFKIDTTKYEQTFAILHKSLTSSHIFKMKDLNNDELIRVIVAASSLKLNNKNLVGELLKITQIRLKTFKPEQLILLARATVIYVKQFEQFFIAVHAECLTKLHLFSFDQKSVLKQTFSRTRILFPDSPLIDTRI